MRSGMVLIGIIFAVALAVIVGNRLSSEAMAVVVGTVCGISASIPVTIGLVIAASSHWGRDGGRDVAPQRLYDDAPRPYASQPPVVIFSPSQAQMPYGYAPNPYALPPAVDAATWDSREFKIVGGE